jgi:nitrate reductase gamma subunit
MTVLLVSKWVALAGLAICAAGLGLRWRRSMARTRPRDLAPARGSEAAGVAYSFTAGMMPWAKESTRYHWAAYLRGIGFHIGIFIGLPLIVVGPWWGLVPRVVQLGLGAALGLGALLGAAGIFMRIREPILRTLSTADDYAAIVLVSAFLALEAAALASASWMPAMYLAAGILLAYIPLGKIRHCLYFFFARAFFGQFVGRRAVIHPHVSDASPTTLAGEAGR